MSIKAAATKIAKLSGNLGTVTPYIVEDYLLGETVDMGKLRQAINRVWNELADLA